MTATLGKTCDVFISHAPSDTHLAKEVADNLHSVGLETYYAGTVEPGMDLADSIWQALAESRALIAIISPDVPPSSMGFVEIGAATAWNHPVFILINGPSSTKLPPALRRYPVYPIGRLDEVIQRIRTGFEPLTDMEHGILAGIYRDLGTSVDQLSQSPKSLRQLAAKFNAQTKKQLSGERLMSELLRMRKTGQLPRLRTRTAV